VADSKHEETFKVIDRRHFTEEGNLRPEAVELERREEEAAAKEAAAKKAANASKPAATAQSNPTTKSGAAPGAGSASSAAAKSAIADAEAAYGAQDKPASTLIAPGDASPDASDSLTGEQSQSSRSFQMLVDFLTRNAAAMLGGMADPRTGQPFVDLEGAREVIDMLDALREKTRGNLSKEDDQLLLEVLGSLKLTFMEISKAAAEAMAKKAKVK
jgi:Domain of unknown function (DUF1844)